MKILAEPIAIEELQTMALKMFGNLVKAVVDIERNVVAIDGELHVDLAEMLVQQGSKSQNMWGVNIHPDMPEDWLEFDSLINLKPHMGKKTSGVGDPIIREKIITILQPLILL